MPGFDSAGWRNWILWTLWSDGIKALGGNAMGRFQLTRTRRVRRWRFEASFRVRWGLSPAELDALILWGRREVADFDEAEEERREIERARKDDRLAGDFARSGYFV